MEDRRDALAAAAEVVLAIERAARDEPAQTVATVGTLTLEPGAVSVIPARVRLGVDLRGIDVGSLGAARAGDPQRCRRQSRRAAGCRRTSRWSAAATR